MKATAIIGQHERFCKEMESEKWINLQSFLENVCASLPQSLSMLQNVPLVHFAYRKDLNDMMNEMQKTSSKLFAKTSGRSWKDVICKSTRFKIIFDRLTNNSKSLTRNEKIISLLVAFNECSQVIITLLKQSNCKVKEPNEILTSLVLSKRVKNDLSRVLQLTSEEELPISIAVREWVSIHPSMVCLFKFS